MTKLEFIPATSEIIVDFYGHKPPVTIKAIAARREGRTIGVAGVCLRGVAYFMFSDLTTEFTGNKRDIIRGLKAMRVLLDTLKLPVFAVPDKDDVLIRHMGVETWHSC